MRRYIRHTVFFVLPVLLLLVAVNYLGDAARIFHRDYEVKMAEIIHRGESITNLTNFDSRIFQKEIIARKDSCPEILVLGSSRTKQINSENFPHQTVFNSSVPGASLEDIIALYQLYKDSDLVPEKLILGIDPWVFNSSNELTEWKSISESYHRFFHETEKRGEGTVELMKNLVSLSYFQSSIRNIPLILEGKADPIPTNEKYNQSNTILPDGALVFGADFRDASPEDIEFRSREYLSGDIYGIEEFHSISPELWSDFESLIGDMRNNGIEIEFVITPYAPLVYETVKTGYPMVIETEKRIKEFARKENIKVYGSFDPERLGFTPKDFYDGIHCSEEGIEEILKQAP